MMKRQAKLDPCAGNDEFVNVSLAHILRILETGYVISSKRGNKRKKQVDECMKLAHYTPPWRNYNASVDQSRELRPVRMDDVCDIPNTLPLIENVQISSHIDPRCLVSLPRDQYNALCNVSSNLV